MKRILTAAALAAALLSSAPRAAAVCPYTVGPLGRYIAPAIVQGMTATNENQIEVWCGGALCVGRPGLFCCCCRPGAGLFLLFAEGVRFFT